MAGEVIYILRHIPGVSYSRALEIVARLPGDVELDLALGALDDGPRMSEVQREPSF